MPPVPEHIRCNSSENTFASPIGDRGDLGRKKKKNALIPPVQKGNIENCIFCLFTLRKNPRR